MKLHILGICGTFMGSLALLARALGHRVTGSDANVYPPMSDLLAGEGIVLAEGYDPSHIPEDTELVVIGNALSRGNPAVEFLLDAGLPYTSGPEWLGREVLSGRHVVAVAGTHGKTTTASMLAWILEDAGLDPGFLIGGVPGNFPVSARLGGGPCFVIEADEYDTAFFDKRSKFVHYRPRTLLLNNLEYDHADIFPDLAAIETQFHHLLRTVPGSGEIVVNDGEAALARVLARGCWSRVTVFGDSARCAWSARADDAAGRKVTVTGPGVTARFHWALTGRHNLSNAVAALATAAALGVEAALAGRALERFKPPRRRQELLADRGGVRVFDDFAHHPTAIARTIEGLAAAHPGRRLLVALEPRSNSMRSGAHAGALGPALALADEAWVLARRELGWNPEKTLAGHHVHVAPSVDRLLASLGEAVRAGDVVVFMSNGAFDNAPRRFAAALDQVPS